MTVNEFWARLGINAAIVVVGIFVALALQIGPIGLVFSAVGVIGALWTVARAVTQTRRMNAAIAAKRQSTSS